MSDQETTDNFFQAWAAWDRREPPPVSFRLYYNDLGEPLFYTMEDLPGNYIEIDPNTYVLQPQNVKVVDGKLHIIKQDKKISKLAPSTDHGTSCHPGDICIVVPESMPNQRWKKTYES